MANVEILAYIERDGESLLAVWYEPSDWNNGQGHYDVVPDLPYVWRTDGKFIDRAVECCACA